MYPNRNIDAKFDEMQYFMFESNSIYQRKQAKIS